MRGSVRPANIAVLPLGLPGLPSHLRLDPLSPFFILILLGGACSACRCSEPAIQDHACNVLGLLCLEYHLFLASMAMVLLADVLLCSWLPGIHGSVLLISGHTDHTIADIRRAGYLYLLSRMSSIAILLESFGRHAGRSRHRRLILLTRCVRRIGAVWASVTFLLALFGFGAKAGVLRAVWLPKRIRQRLRSLCSDERRDAQDGDLRHPACDLRSADMQLWWWGVLALTLGLMTAVFRLMFAAVQGDMKRGWFMRSGCCGRHRA